MFKQTLKTLNKKIEMDKRNEIKRKRNIKIKLKLIMNTNDNIVNDLGILC